MHVLGFGEGSVDYVHVVPELPRHGSSKLQIVESAISPGGQVATTMAACAEWGVSAGYLGPVGSDGQGRMLLEALAARGVDTSSAVVRQSRTRFAVILVHQRTGERVVLWNRDERLDLSHDELPSLPGGLEIVHVDGSDEPASIEIARRATRAGAIVTCDIDCLAGRTHELVAAATIPILAEHLPAQLTGVEDPERALRALQRPHHRFVCVARGERGSAALVRNEYCEVPALPVDAVDTTSAGDVFRAGIIYGLLREWPVPRLLSFANAAAARACTRVGAISSVPALTAIGHTVDAPSEGR